MMSESPEEYRTKAAEYSERAQQTPEGRLRNHFQRMERSCLLMAKNAAWLKSTDEFLREMRGH
jgi:hypothetical protein